MSIPAFADLSKASNDLLGKDFYHVSAANFELKSNTPNGVAFKTTAKATHEGATSGAVEGKWTDKASGKPTNTMLMSNSRRQGHLAPPPLLKPMRFRDVHFVLSSACGGPLMFNLLAAAPNFAMLTMYYRRAGTTITQSWNTLNALDFKAELNDSIAKGLKAEILGSFLPASQATGAKFNLHFKQANFHGRAFFDLLKGPTANVDAVIGQDGFLVGASGGYDVNKAAITNYAAALGYVGFNYSATVTAANNLSVFSAAYYHKVNSQVEAGAKATWDSKTGKNPSLEVASKYRIDPLSFTKAKINDRGIAAVSYNVLFRPGVTFGIGASFDTQKADQGSHKIGYSLTFEG